MTKSKEEFCLHCAINKTITDNFETMVKEYGEHTGPYIMAKLAEVVAQLVFASEGHQIEAMMAFMEELSKQMNNGNNTFEFVQLDARDPTDREAVAKMDEVHEMTKTKARGPLQ